MVTQKWKQEGYEDVVPAKSNLRARDRRWAEERWIRHIGHKGKRMNVHRQNPILIHIQMHIGTPGISTQDAYLPLPQP